jgi:hypothetical protein
MTEGTGPHAARGRAELPPARLPEKSSLMAIVGEAHARMQAEMVRAQETTLRKLAKLDAQEATRRFR